MKKFYFLLLGAFLLSSCTASKSDICTVTDYEPRYAKGFILGHDSISSRKIIVIRNPFQAEHSHEQIVVLDSTRKSSSLTKGLLFLKTPVKRVALLSASFSAMLTKAGFADNIVGISGTKYITDSVIQKRIRQKEIIEIGDENNLDFEKMKAAGCDLILLYGLNGENSRLEKKLRQVGIPYIYIGDYTESSPLGKCEWVVALSEIMGDGRHGIELFSEIEENYLELKNMHFVSRPKVMINTPYRDVWFVPGRGNYMARLIEDAGAEYIFHEKAESSSVPISMEEALERASRCDYWINVGQYTSYAKFCEDMPLFRNLNVVRQRRVYNNNRIRTANGGSAFWEKGVMEPDLILKDLITIFHPEISNKELKYYICLQ